MSATTRATRRRRRSCAVRRWWASAPTAAEACSSWEHAPGLQWEPLGSEDLPYRHRIEVIWDGAIYRADYEHVFAEVTKYNQRSWTSATRDDYRQVVEADPQRRGSAARPRQAEAAVGRRKLTPGGPRIAAEVARTRAMCRGPPPRDHGRARLIESVAHSSRPTALRPSSARWTIAAAGLTPAVKMTTIWRRRRLTPAPWTSRGSAPRCSTLARATIGRSATRSRTPTAAVGTPSSPSAGCRGRRTLVKSRWR